MVLPPIAVGSPIFTIEPILLLSNLNPLKLILISCPGLVSTISAITAHGILAIRVARAAPPIPHLKTIRNNGSNIRLITTPNILRSIGFTVSP